MSRMNSLKKLIPLRLRRAAGPPRDRVAKFLMFALMLLTYAALYVLVVILRARLIYRAIIIEKQKPCIF
jgi:hypothetical protein